MAGLGYKTFTAGEVLTAANLQGYAVDQSIMVFDDSTARTSALGTLVAEGMVSYLKDDGAGSPIIEYYNGTAWAGISNPGDITSVTAGTGLTGGGTAGAVTIAADYTTIGSAISIAASQITDQENLAINATQISNTVVSDAGTARTITSADQGKVLLFTSGSAITVTIGDATDFDTGGRVDIVQDGAGTMTIQTSGTTVLYGRGTAGTAYTVGQQYDAVTLLCIGTDNYRIIGNAEAV